MQRELAKKIFNEYLDNIEICSGLSLEKDGYVLAQLIFLKYAGEDMVDILREIYKKVYDKNHYISKTINVE